MAFAFADDGCRLYYELKGSGEPVVLIPGLGGDGRFWASVENELEHKFLLVTVDHRGAGRSDRPVGGYSISRIARDVAAILDHAGFEAADLVGHSTGGTVVQTLGLECAHRARSLTISGSWARPDNRFRDLFTARALLLDHGQVEAYQRLTHVFGYPSDWIESHADTLDRAMLNASDALQPYEVAAARVRMLLEFNRADELNQISLPTLVIGAKDDIMIPFDRSLELSRLIQSANLIELTGGHFYPKTNPKQFAQQLTRFLGDVRTQERLAAEQQ
ncbi:alpha/beta hydrolase [Pararhizobium sp. YC-54]|uniref:alpha/beta hydrolase n=1 Tax=Pararhizobium sp. YC-54 TaxID=2986920 RepID=UPI0021F7910F|nr:alpha/beta hydrolase [Pararhizobium sp. YC-54]MCW0001496.1 alpha/beta hydrolase [Pararhizobium sp. YC-54]